MKRFVLLEHSTMDKECGSVPEGHEEPFVVE